MTLGGYQIPAGTKVMRYKTKMDKIDFLTDSFQTWSCHAELREAVPTTSEVFTRKMDPW